jgi:UDP-N-acetylglucosamine acyltransferase
VSIHPTAIVAHDAKVHDNAIIGPFCIVDSGAEIGEGTVLDSNVRIYGPARLGRFNRVCHGVTLGSDAQDLGFTPEKARPLTIGDHNHFKENVNISCGIKTEEGTRIGSHNYFMAFSHVGHDCIVGDHNILANTATLAGHVELAHHCFISGQVAVHQFVRIAAYVMVGGISGVAQDVPPYVLINGQRAEILGLNVVGLRRNGFSQATRTAIKRAYRTLYTEGLSRETAIRQLADSPLSEVRAIAEFAANSPRGLVRYVRI